MSKRVKIKVKPGKAKIKLKSGDEALPLSNEDLRGLLCGTVASAVGLGPGVADVPRITREGQAPGSVEPDSAPELGDESRGP